MAQVRHIFTEFISNTSEDLITYGSPRFRLRISYIISIVSKEEFSSSFLPKPRQLLISEAPRNIASDIHVSCNCIPCVKKLFALRTLVLVHNVNFFKNSGYLIQYGVYTLLRKAVIASAIAVVAIRFYPVVCFL